jgi:hypothetical protein
MLRFIYIFLVTAFSIAASVSAAQAQTPPPPIKPGLWQIHGEREVNGQKQPDASDRLKNMSPEKRAQIEAMMKQHGMGGSLGMGQVCYTRETLERSPWAGVQTDCKADFSTRSASSWKWHTSCPKSGYEADGEAVFANSENYTVTTTSVSKVDDKVRNTRMTMTGKWVSADCGDVKPFEPNPK